MQLQVLRLGSLYHPPSATTALRGNPGARGPGLLRAKRVLDSAQGGGGIAGPLTRSQKLRRPFRLIMTGCLLAEIAFCEACGQLRGQISVGPSHPWNSN